MIRIAGDICFADGYFDQGIGVKTKLERGENPFAHINLTKNDFWIGNFESVCSSQPRGNNEFLVSPNNLKHFNHMDLYCIANNHVMQHGDDAYFDMINIFKSQHIAFAGSINKKSHIFKHQDKTVGLIAFSERPDNFTNNPLYWHLPELAELEEQIRCLNNCDFKIAYVHWGNEYMDFPYIDQKQLARFLIDCGIDLVIGMHPHVLQGMEIYKGKHIFYSLGNFVFNMAWERTKYSIVVNVDLSQNFPVISYTNYIIEDMFPRIIQKELIPVQYQMETLSNKIDYNIENEKYYRELFHNVSQYKKSNYKWIAQNIFKMSPKASFLMIKDFFKRLIQR